MSDTHRQAADQHELAAHAHRTAAEHNEKGKNELGNWHLERAQEYSDHAYKLAKQAHSNSGQIESLQPMPAPRDNELLHQSHNRAAELHDRAAEAHRIAQRHERGDVITGGEDSRQALQHSQAADNLTKALASGHGVMTSAHDEVAALAYQLWQARGCPYGSAEEDWLRAESEVRARISKR